MNGHILLQSSTWAKEAVIFLLMQLPFDHAQTKLTWTHDEQTNSIDYSRKYNNRP